MTKDDHMIHVRVDKDNLKAANRRAKESHRGNMTAYINALIAEDARKFPDLVKRTKPEKK